MAPTSATFVPPSDDPPAGPSVKSQAFAADSATSAQGPAADWALSRVGKLSIRQKSCPGGNSETVFSASDLITKFFGATAADGSKHSPTVKADSKLKRNR